MAWTRWIVPMIVGGTASLVVTASSLSDQAPKATSAPASQGAAATKPEANEASANNADGTKKPEKSRSDLLAARRLALIQRHVASAEIRSDDAEFPTAFADKPIFRYSDPARGHVAAAVWKLGDEGRPKAILTTELDRFNNGQPTISHEYTSLTSTRFSLALDGMHWAPAGTRYEFKPIPSAPEPAQSAPRRLVQIRDLARRFAGSEIVKNENCELRLLPQPVDRYVPSQAERADGAIFFFTFGTNPEVMLLIESDDKQWTYAAGRMTGAEEVVLTFDEKLAWRGPPLEKGSVSTYTGSVAPIAIPGIAPDGREIDD